MRAQFYEKSQGFDYSHLIEWVSFRKLIEFTGMVMNERSMGKY
jgi:hypothetical protein